MFVGEGTQDSYCSPFLDCPSNTCVLIKKKKLCGEGEETLGVGGDNVLSVSE